MERLRDLKEAGKAIVLLNFPNNPTGYTPGEEEVQGIITVLKEAAEQIGCMRFVSCQGQQ